MERFIYFLILFLLGILAGFNIFLTFIVAPLMFSHFNPRLAGEIMNFIFPYYFASGWIIGIVIYSLVAILSFKNKNIVQDLKGFVIGLSVLIISFMALHKTVLPIAQNLNNSYYMLLDEGKKDKAEIIHNKFKKIHVISSLLNTVNLLLLVFLFYYVYTYINKKPAKMNMDL